MKTLTLLFALLLTGCYGLLNIFTEIPPTARQAVTDNGGTIEINAGGSTRVRLVVAGDYLMFPDATGEPVYVRMRDIGDATKPAIVPRAGLSDAAYEDELNFWRTWPTYLTYTPANFVWSTKYRCSVNGDNVVLVPAVSINIPTTCAIAP